MIATQDQKVGFVTPPAGLLDNTAVTTTAIDTKGWEYLDVLVLVGDIDADMTALKLQESEDDGGSDAYADIAGANFATGTQPDGTSAALPTAAAGDNKIFHFGLNLVGVERYVDVVATAGNGSNGAYITIIYILSRGKTSPSTYAGRGFAGEILL